MAGRVTLEAHPNFTRSGSVSGWKIQRANTTVCEGFKSKGAAQRGLSRLLNEWTGAGYGVTLKLFNSHNQLVGSYNYNCDKVLTSKTERKPTPPGKTSAKKNGAKKAPAKRKSTGKKGTQSSALKRYQAFMGAAKAKGLTHKQAGAAWKKYKTPPGTIAEAKARGTKAPKPSNGRKAPAKKSAAKKAISPGLKKYNAFMGAAKAKGLTHKQASAAWKKVKVAPKTIADAKARGGRVTKSGNGRKAPAKKKKSSKSGLPSPSRVAKARVAKGRTAKSHGGKKRKMSAYNRYAKAFFQKNAISKYPGRTPIAKSQARMTAMAEAYQAQK